MGTFFVPKTTVQSIPEIQINSRIVDRANEPHYECPTGKKAIFTGKAVCTSRGAAGQVSIRDPTNTYNLCTWDGSVGLPNVANPFKLPDDSEIPITMELTAGQQILSTQDVGTNAEVNVNGIIKELPA